MRRLRTVRTASPFGYEVDSWLLGSLGTVQPFVEDATVFAMINYSGTWNGGLFTYNGTPLTDGSRFTVGSQQWQIDYNSPTGGSNYTSDYLPSSSFVTVMAVPEPGAVALMLAGLAATLGATRIRKPPSRER